MCEPLAIESKKTNSEDYYMLGMFTLMDIILKRNPNEIFKELPVSDEIIQTLCNKRTEMTLYLELADLNERLDYKQAVQRAKELGIG